jgi:phasin
MTDFKSTKVAAPAAMFGAAAFEMPKFEMPKFDGLTGLREFTERGVAQAKEAYEKLRGAAEEANGVLEAAGTAAAKGSAEYGRKVIDVAQANTNAAFDYAMALLGAKQLSDVAELSSDYVTKRCQALSEQTTELSALAWKVATDTAGQINRTGAGFVKSS